MRAINLLHSGAAGDLLYTLPTAKSFGMANIYIDEKYITKEAISILIPLIKSQPYINECKKFEGERIDLDMDRFRVVGGSKYTLLSLIQLSMYNRYYNLSEPWILNIEPQYVSDIIVNRTTRYPGSLDWQYLVHKYKDRMTFIGTKEEHTKFCNDFEEVAYHATPDFLIVAQIIKGSKLFIGNQSVCYSIAEGMKHERVLEVCFDVPNCMPVGKGSHCDWEETILDDVECILK